MKVSMIGMGKLGMPVAVTMALKGHDVKGFDLNPKRMSKEPQDFIETGPDGTGDFNDWLAKSTLTFGSLEEVCKHGDLIFVAVQTPHEPLYEGITTLPDTRKDFDYSHLINAVTDMALYLDDAKTVVVISTVMPGTMRKYIMPIVEPTGASLIYNPSFIAMNFVMADFLNPEFILVGHQDWPNTEAATENLLDLFGPQELELISEFYSEITSAPVRLMSIESAELSKLAYNVFIGFKIVFANTLMEICHKIPQADVESVTDTMKAATTRLISSQYLSGGMGDSGGCLKPGGIVYTETGPKPIETIKIGEHVLSGDGKLHKVLKTWERVYSGPIHKFVTRGCPPIWITPEHNVYVRDDTRKKVNRKGRLRKNNRVGLGLKDWMGPQYETTIDTIQAKDAYLPFPVITEPDAVLPEHATADYLHLAGWYLSEGHIEVVKTSTGKIRSARANFALHCEEQEYAKEIKDLLLRLAPPKKFGRGSHSKGPTFKYKKNTKAMIVRYGNKEICEKLLNDFGRLSRYKKLPSWALWGPLDLVKELLKGMWRGDGMTSRSGMSLSTISPDIAYGNILLLHRLGIPATLKIIKRVDRVHLQYYVNVRNSIYMERMSELTGLPIRHKAINDEKRYILTPLLDDGNYYRPIMKNEVEHYDGKVYNLWIDTNHSYVTQVGTVSNCHPRDAIALSNFARESKLGFDIFESIMMSREAQASWLAGLMVPHAPLSKFLLGAAYKPGVALTIGSHALLVRNILATRGHEMTVLDPYIDTRGAEAVKSQVSETIGVFLVGTKHPEFADYSFAPGSVVIDPWRYIKDQDGVTVIRLGEFSDR